MVFLDTNVCIYYLNGTHPSVRDNLLRTPPNEVKIPIIVHSELIFGAQKSRRREENIRKVYHFLQPFEVINYTRELSETYAEIRVAAESSGKIVGPNDLLIATITVANNGTLVTRNTKEFSRINGLKLTEW